MASNLTEKRTIVITGGASGIGKAVALICAARGDAIAILDSNTSAAKKRLKKLCKAVPEMPWGFRAM